MGCLSTERKLTGIKDAEIISILFDILDFNSTSSMLVCWECNTALRNFLKFKRRVKFANEYLEFSHKKSDYKCLTSLMKCKTEVVECVSDLDAKKDPNVFSRYPVNSIAETKDSRVIAESCEDLEKDETFGDPSLECYNFVGYDQSGSSTFIKVEDIDEDDVLAEEGDHQSVGASFEDGNGLKTALKPDPEVEFPIIKTNFVGREEFDESDDETLAFNKKKKMRREKKDVVSNAKSAGVKGRGGRCRGEQPAGVVDHPRVGKILGQLGADPSHLEMVVLTWEEVDLEREKALRSVTYTRHEYKCRDCILGFNHRFKLENHMKKHDEASGTVVCTVCKIRCRDKEALRAHRRRHQLRWRCVVCGAAWSRAAVAADHVSRRHGGPAPRHTCALCGHHESTLSKFRSHMKNHAERPKCELCGKTFRDRTNLKTHLFIHNGEKEYSCPQCSKRFLFKKAMEVHMVTHEAPSHLYCLQCDMNFKNCRSYYQHIKYNLKHIDPAKLKYACTLCDKKFAKPKRLEEHNFAVHLNTKPIACTVQDCSFSCSSRSALRTHLRMIHRQARATRNHVCHLCGKAYTTKKTLEGHLRSHSGERPLRCGLCPSAFAYDAALYNHNRLVHLKKKSRETNTKWQSAEEATSVNIDEDAV